MFRKIYILFSIYLKSLVKPLGFRLTVIDFVKLFKLNKIKEDGINSEIDLHDRIEAMNDAAKWLITAQNKMHDQGFGSYKIFSGWTTSYPETTGYILPTLLNYVRNFDRTDLIPSLKSSADWLLEIQKESGGWQGGYMAEHQPEVIFNTGQIIRGLLAIYCETCEEKYLQSAIKAGNWLCSVQHNEGYWDQHTYKNIVRVFDAYVDVPLIELSLISKNENYKNAAIKNLNWIIEHKQHENGWFSDCENNASNNENPILHTIAYTIDGLLDSGILLNNQIYIDAATKAADALLRNFIEKGFLYGRYNKCWEPTVKFFILTGCAQIAIVWLKLYSISKNKTYLEESIKLNSFLRNIQKKSNIKNRNVQGSLSGSFPIWAKYEPFSFPNWATKYYLDSLLLEKSAMFAKMVI